MEFKEYLEAYIDTQCGAVEISVKISAMDKKRDLIRDMFKEFANKIQELTETND